MPKPTTIPENFEWVPCPCCGADDCERDRTARDWTGEKPGASTDVVRCRACGLYYTNPRPTLESLPSYYTDDYVPFQANQNHKVAGLRGLVLRSAYGSPDVRPSSIGIACASLVGLFKRPRKFGYGVRWHGKGRLLDFGCGQGAFLRRMRDLGWDVQGIDFSPIAVKAIRESGIPAHLGTLPHPDLADAHFDVITMRHALEHVPDPLVVLGEIRRLLLPAGRLVIQIPNYASWDVQQFGDAAKMVDIMRHMVHYTPSTLQMMLQRTGFRVRSLQTISHAGQMTKSYRRVAGQMPASVSARVKIKPLRQLWGKLLEMQSRANEINAVADVAP